MPVGLLQRRGSGIVTSRMRPFLRLLAALRSLPLAVLPLIFFATLASAQVLNQLDRIPASADLTQTTQLTGHVPHWAAATHDAGPVAAGLQLQHVALVLSRAPEVEAAFQQLLIDQQNPESPRYHQWLTPEQTGALYGPTKSDVAAVSAWLTAQGLQVEGVTPSRMFITFSGDAASVQNAFHTEIHNFKTADAAHPVQYSITREPSVPAALAPVIQGFVGLSEQYNHPYLHSTSIPTASALKTHSQAGNSLAAGVTPDVYLGSGYNWILPADFAIIYDINSVYNSGIQGSGERVAIIGSSAVATSDVTAFESIAGLPSALPTQITVPPYSPVSTAGGSAQLEATLDVDRVLSTAPSAGADLLLIPALSDTDIQAAINYEIATLNDPILSMSFGSCEYDSASTRASTYNTLFATAISEGISLFVSSGDSEATGCATSGDTYAKNAGNLQVSTNVLCTPDITCVGGTEFNDSPTATYWSTTNNSSNNSTALSYIPEGVWNEPVSVSSNNVTSYVILGGGGGPSVFWTKPTWQTGTGVPTDGVRDTPDMSLSSSGHNAYLGCAAFDNETCASGGYVAGFYGTSAAAPGMAGITALLVQKLGARQGNLNPLLYKLAASSPSAFHDATPASSGVSPCVVTTASLCDSSAPGTSGLTGGVSGYLLTTGYDQATGLGSVDVANLIAAAVVATSKAATTNTLTANKTSITTSQSITFTSTITSSTAGTPTGTVQFQVAGVNSGSAVTLSSAAAQTTISFPSVGTFTVTAVYSGDSTYAASTGTISVTVTAPVLPATTTTLTGTTGSITAQQTATYTATITSGTAGTPTGTVQFYSATGVTLGSAVTVSGAKAILPATSLPVGTYSIYAVYSGDTSYAASTSNTIPLTVTAAPTTTTISPLTATLTTQQSQAFTATVATASGTPTGTVQFYVDGTASGSAIALSGLTATSAAITFTTGTHTVTATYSGSTVFGSSTSTGATVTVTLATFTLSATPTTLSLAPGATTGNTATLSYTPTSGFTGTVIQSCSVAFTGSGATVDTPTCSLSTPTVSVSGTTSGGTLTIYSTAPNVQTLKALAINRGGRTGLGGVAFATLLLLLIPGTRRRALRNWRGLAMLLVATAAVLTASGCGSGGKTQTTPVGTTAGNYSVTVTGTSGTLTASTVVTLTIQ